MPAVQNLKPSAQKQSSTAQPSPLPIFPADASSLHAKVQQLGPNTLQPMPTGDSDKPVGGLQWPSLESDRICYNSVNCFTACPDVPARKVLSCSCGQPIVLDEDWYTEIFDGTLVCSQCSSCLRCGVQGFVSRRRLVSIGGYVLCYECVRHFGQPRLEAFKPKILPHPSRDRARLFRMMSSKSNAATLDAADGNGLMTAPLWQVHRHPDQRPMLRYRNYPQPRRHLPASRDPLEQPLGFYTAGRSPFSERMLCPSCKLPAEGRRARPVVVPAISAVYHRACFCCVICRQSFSVGYKTAGEHFVFCTCPQPLVWCTRLACQRERRDHHGAFKCQLEPVHPGGRSQRDMELPVRTRKANPATKPGSEATGEAAAPAASDAASAATSATPSPTTPAGASQQALRSSKRSSTKSKKNISQTSIQRVPL